MIYRVDILVLKCVFAWVVLSMHAAQDPVARDSKSEKPQSWAPRLIRLLSNATYITEMQMF